MTPPSPLPGSPTPTPRARRRRVKRGIVAGYIHDISPRHRAPDAAPIATARPVLTAAPATR
jgi:hypothetical protein